MIQNNNITLNISGKGLQSIAFLNKFITEFPHVASMDLEYNRIENNDFI